MAVLKGCNGAVKVGATPTVVGEVTGFTLDRTADIVDTTALGNCGWKQSAVSLKSWSCTVNANFDYTDAGQLLLNVGDSVAVELYVGGTEVGGRKFSGNVIVSSAPISNEVGGLTTISFSGAGTGELTEATVL